MVVMLLALVDWAIAVSLVVVGVQQTVAVPLLLVAAGMLISLQIPRLQRVRRAVAGSEPDRRWPAAEQALGQEWSPRVARLVLREPRLLWSVVLLVRRRQDGDSHPTYGGYRDALPTWIVLSAVAMVEIGVTEVLPIPATVRKALLVLGLWGLVVVLGLVAALVVHPHVVETDRVRFRVGFWSELTLPRASIGRVTVVQGTVSCGLCAAKGEASLSASGSVNVSISLDRPVEVAGVLVDTVRVWVDQPRLLCADLRRPR